MAAPKKPGLTAIALRLFAAAALGKALVSLYRIIITSAPDFAYYYQAAQEIFQRVGNPIHLLPPPSLLVFAPLSLIPYEAAQTGWVILSFVSLIAVVWRVAEVIGIRDGWVRVGLISLAYLSFPTQFTLGMGQVNLIALWLLVLSVSLESQRKSIYAAGLFTLAILLKPELALLVPVFLFIRRWKFVVGLSGFLSTAIGVSFAVFGVDAFVGYHERLNIAAAGWRDISIYYNQSLSGLLSRMGDTGGTWYVGLSVLVMSVTVYAFIKRRAAFPHVLWEAVPLFLLIEPIAWQHHFVFLIPTYFSIWKRKHSFTTAVWLVISYFLVSINFAAPAFLDTMPLGWFAASHVAVGTIILWVMTLT